MCVRVCMCCCVPYSITYRHLPSVLSSDSVTLPPRPAINGQSKKKQLFKSAAATPSPSASGTARTPPLLLLPAGVPLHPCEPHASPLVAAAALATTSITATATPPDATTPHSGPLAATATPVAIAPAPATTAAAAFAARRLRRRRARSGIPRRGRGGGIGHDTLSRHVVDYPVLIVPEGGDEELVPEGGAVGLIVEETNRDVLPIRDRLPGKTRTGHGRSLNIL